MQTYMYMRLLGYPASRISILTTYNGQKHLIRDILDQRCAKNLLFGLPNKVSTVDKFQGQEAPVCILSLCSSYGEYGSRGLAFILDRNRVNVAISRAQCLAVVVGDPRIATSPAGSIGEMMLLNLLCKLLR